jgi:putative DNA primase/helicase
VANASRGIPDIGQTTLDDVVTDASGAFASRAIVLQTRNSFFDNEDLGLTNALMEELPGILLWAIGGWMELQRRGSLLQPTSSQELLDELYDLSSPVGEFVRDRCEVGPEFSVPRADHFQEYQHWSEEKGRKFTQDSTGFGRDLRAAVPGIGSSQPRVEGSRVRRHTGIRIMPFG